MTQPKATPRSRRRGLKTWTAFGDLGRRPTEYEIVTHNLNHTTGPVPLELGPDVHGNVWLREHRDSIRLTAANWDGFRDPDAVTYASYVAGQDDQETYVEGLLEEFDAQDYDASLSSEAISLLRHALTPSRYLAHGLQMLSAYLQQLAPSSYISGCAAFQTADQLRRVQLTAYRTTQLQRTHTRRDFATGERETWEHDAAWQPLRKAVETALVEFDWDRALVITNLVVKPVADLILLKHLAQQAQAVDARLDALVCDNLWLDSQRSQRWTIELVRFLIDADPGNREVLIALLGEFTPLGQEMAGAAAALLCPADGTRGAEIAAAVRTDWASFLGRAGLDAPAT